MFINYCKNLRSYVRPPPGAFSAAQLVVLHAPNPNIMPMKIHNCMEFSVLSVSGANQV